MTTILGLTGNSGWTKLVRRPKAAQLLDYLTVQWSAYEQKFIGLGQAFSRRREPVLTKGFGAYLTQQSVKKAQPFDGNFHFEAATYILNADGSPKEIARTDIQWELGGFPIFVVEMKIIGRGRPATAYIRAGVARFVSGQYAKESAEGAMWAFFRVGARHSKSSMAALLDGFAPTMKCVASKNGYRTAPSNLAPNSAAFDTTHERDDLGPITLAHVFVQLTH